MTDIDLIPTDYGNQLWQRRFLVLLAWAAAGFLLLALGAAAAFGYASTQIDAEVRKLQSEHEVSSNQREKLEALSQRQVDQQKQLALLNGLRSGASVETVFLTIDRALEGQPVWFLRWKFQRAGILVSEIQPAVNTGYFIVAKEDTQFDEDRPWQVETHMEIHGRARDHQVLSRFVKRLFEQSEIVDVRVQKTTLRRYLETSVVDFDLAVVLNSNVRS